MSTPALILHDDEPTLALLRATLGSAGFEPSDVRTAWAAASAELPTPPRLVVLGMSAIDERDMEIVSILRSRWPAAHLLVLYPSALRERAARALALGADAYLPEPFYRGELAAIAARAATRGRAPTVPKRQGGVEQLAAGVAHSIRNPLQILELQLGDADTPPDVAGMREQLRRIAAVVEGLARFSGTRDLALRPLDIGRLVAHVFGDRAKPHTGAAITVHPAADHLDVLGSAELLRAGLESLRDRAVRLTPAGAKIATSARLRTDDGQRFVEISVTDGGPTLGAESRERLFDPYPDSGSVQDGTGLDLAGLAGIVRDHGGTIDAVPAETSGTTIVIRLPAHAETPNPAGGP